MYQFQPFKCATQIYVVTFTGSGYIYNKVYFHYQQTFKSAFLRTIYDWIKTPISKCIVK